ncbi:MAG: uracil phosphoribosyltransferase [Chloroflexi bacterium]|nr:uracil phosphoribosyltransferase [Chloroflexota bacterium]MCL5074796.1 uracil phosphoribosyltransferase [Chloroflexota bacterium]
MIHSFESSPVISYHLMYLRDKNTEPSQFREHLIQLGTFLGYEIARALPKRQKKVLTPMNYEATAEVLHNSSTVLIAILRAALPLTEGLLRILHCDVGFVGLSRDEETLKPRFRYAGDIDVEDKNVVYADTMIATGGSIIELDRIVCEKGKPKRKVLAGAISTDYSLDRIKKAIPEIEIYVAGIDNKVYEEGFIAPGLNGKGYIVPGLGDAGDRSFGKTV